jgi:transcriptional regulator GlxA family with amidase domain
MRVERALAELQRSDRPLAEIAVAHGFSDQSHLTRLGGRAPAGRLGRSGAASLGLA